MPSRRWARGVGVLAVLVAARNLSEKAQRSRDPQTAASQGDRTDPELDQSVAPGEVQMHDIAEESLRLNTRTNLRDVAEATGQVQLVLQVPLRGLHFDQDRAARRYRAHFSVLALARPSGYTVPALSQAGAPVQVSGPFDGDLSNSSVRINGQDADPIGESPRQIVVRGPQEGQAETPVEVRDRGAVVTMGAYRNVSVQLCAGATSLRSGQETTLTIRVTGVEGLQETLPVRLTNNTPSVVQMEGGDEQTLCVRPDDVGVDGSWKADRGLTGVRMGGFGIRAVVRQPGPHSDQLFAVSDASEGRRLVLETEEQDFSIEADLAP